MCIKIVHENIQKDINKIINNDVNKDVNKIINKDVNKDIVQMKMMHSKYSCLFDTPHTRALSE